MIHLLYYKLPFPFFLKVLRFHTGLEITPMKYRSAFGIMVNLPYVMMCVVNAGISYVTRSWLATFVLASSPLLVLVVLTSQLWVGYECRWESIILTILSTESKAPLWITNSLKGKPSHRLEFSIYSTCVCIKLYNLCTPFIQ